jgi:energy-coupling factor transport system permease protein
MSLVQYVPSNTFIHRLDPRVKLAALPCVTLLSVILAHPVYLAALLGCILLAWLYIRAPFAYVSRIIILILVFLVMIVLIQGMFYYQRSGAYDTAAASREVFVDLLPADLRVGLIARIFGAADDPSRLLVLYREGVVFGVMLAMRLGCIVSIMPLLTMTTPLTDLMLALVKLRVPWKFAYLVTTAFRFVPLLMSQTDTILNAQKLRGLAVEKSNLVKRITAYAPLAVPVILGAFRNSEQLEMVLACRGFTDVTERTTLYEIRWQTHDSVAVGAMALLTLAAVGLRVVGVASLPV